MSAARDHTEWLSLVETSGPFLSLPVLLRVFPQGLEHRDASRAAALREAYEDWLDRGATSSGIHQAWIRHVLTNLLEWPDNYIAEGQSIPAGLEASQPHYGGTLRPDLVLVEPGGGDGEAPNREPQLLVVIYSPDQDLEKTVSGEAWNASPATRMVELLRGSAVPLGLVTNGEQWMLVYAPRQETSGFASWYADLWIQEPVTLRAFHSLLHLRRFFGVAPADRLAALFAESAKEQQEVTTQLGRQVRRAVELLVQAFDELDAAADRTFLKGVPETEIYDAALTVMMRLVFLFSAEERKLLLLGDPLYDQHYAVSTLREILREQADRQGEEVLKRRHDAWSRLLATFRAVHGGVQHENMRLPAYGGSLFDPDRYPFLEGRASGTLWRTTPDQPPRVNNQIVLHLLEALQMLKVKVPGGGPLEARRLSFRALDIEQIGHVYEGLLDHTGARAMEITLGLDGKKEPEIALSILEARQEKESALLEFLKEETGRTENAVTKALRTTVDENALLMACSRDPRIVKQVRPFAGLLRTDDFGRLVVIQPGSVFVTQGTGRRSSGTHYTPRSLTEPIVQHTLDPLVFIGPAEGWPQAEWKLKTPREILALKVCDLAMGSGAFLVQACRYLAARLVEAWELAEREHPGSILITPDGELSAPTAAERLLPADPEERLAIARRYVADRCLYGVDINPMAVEMAKLSLWLITLQRERPFTFVDHALKCGDSLLGVTSVRQIENFSLRPGDRQITFATANLFRYVDEAAAKRRALENLPSNDHSQIETKNRLHTEAEAATAKVKALADCLIALELRGLDGEAYEDARESEAAKVQALMTRDADASLKSLISNFQSALVAHAREQRRGRRTFHWPVEFPEVIKRGGFNAFVGNPPFIGNKYWQERLWPNFQRWAELLCGEKVGKIDIVALFARRFHTLMDASGRGGIIATTTAREGATLQAGFAWLANNGELYRALSQLAWPGEAGVHVCVVWFGKNRTSIRRVSDDKVVDSIPPSLVGQARMGEPWILANAPWGFQGSHNGKGNCFLLNPDSEWFIRLANVKSPFLRPYITGDDITSGRHHSPPRWCVDCEDLDLAQVRERCPETHVFLLEVAAPVRTQKELAPYKGLIDRWWQMWNHRAPLYRELRGQKTCIAIPMVAKHLDVVRLPSSYVFTNKICVLRDIDDSQFCALLSSLFEAWVIENGGTMGAGRLTIVLSTGIQTFPLLPSKPSDRPSATDFCSQRDAIMIARSEGFTDTYNRFHDRGEQAADIARLRALHVEMDQAVALAYGWPLIVNGQVVNPPSHSQPPTLNYPPLDLGHGFHATKQGERYTLSEPARREVLDRLLALNHQRYAEEVAAGLHEKGAKKKAKAKRAKPSASESPQPDLF
jgi:hypothetical protein